MRWINAGNRKPEDWNTVISIFADSRMPITNVWRYYEDYLELENNGSICGESVNYSEVEWLDESEPTDLPGVRIIKKERLRQIHEEGWSPKNDTQYICGELATVGSLYALPSWQDRGEYVDNLWPSNWKIDWWKPSSEDRIKELAKAGALIAAEIDRLLLLEALNLK